METPISDPIMNCLLEVCCAPEEQEARLAGILIERGVCDETAASGVAAFFALHFDLAPKGSLKALKHGIARVALAKRLETI